MLMSRIIPPRTKVMRPNSLKKLVSPLHPRSQPNPTQPNPITPLTDPTLSANPTFETTAMASEEDHTVYGEEDLDEDDDDDVISEEEEDLTLPDDDEDDSLSSPAVAAGDVTIAVAGVQSPTIAPASVVPDPTKRQRIDDDVTIAAAPENKKQQPLPSDESRRLFQRLWTDEDEIELLNGFLDYTTQRGPHHHSGSSHNHHDTTAFYDQIKSKLQLDFNKNQLVEKLRRLKKKYRNILSKIGSGKDYAFKTPHDQATFEISCKIWGTATAALDEDDPNPNPNIYSTPSANFNLNDHGSNNGFVDPEKKTPRARKRSRGGVKTEEKSPLPLQAGNILPDQSAAVASASIPNLVEDTVKSCLSPLLKELLNNAVNGPVGLRGFGGGGVSLNPLPLGFGRSFNYSTGNVADEKWRKQHILELEVYSKRLELLQDEVKSQLEELRSMGNS